MEYEIEIDGLPPMMMEEEGERDIILAHKARDRVADRLGAEISDRVDIDYVLDRLNRDIDHCLVEPANGVDDRRYGGASYLFPYSDAGGRLEYPDWFRKIDRDYETTAFLATGVERDGRPERPVLAEDIRAGFTIREIDKAALYSVGTWMD